MTCITFINREIIISDRIDRMEFSRNDMFFFSNAIIKEMIMVIIINR